MKITIVAFDLWGFNQKIVDHLKNKGVEVTFIDSSKIRYNYKNLVDRIKNFFYKIFLKKNLKKVYQEEILKKNIQELPNQSIILIVNPKHFTLDTIQSLKNKTSQFIAYNYDSLVRSPLPLNHKELFNKIYSFDTEDIKKYPYLIPITNFNYLEENVNNSPENSAFIVVLKSIERENTLKKIADILDKKNNVNYEFIVVEPELKKTNPNIKLTLKQIPLNIVVEKMKNSKILIDLVRKEQTGLSFRIFEAMALHKKVITNNKNIANYDFYNENNILIIDEFLTDIPNSFLDTPYQEIPKNIYDRYTLSNWTKIVFGI